MEWKIANSQSYFYFVTLIFENKSKVSISITYFNVLTLQDLLGCMKIHFNLKMRGKDWSIPKTKGGIIMIARDLGLLFVTKTAHGFVTQDHGFGSLQLCQTLIIWREIFHTVQVDWFFYFFFKISDPSAWAFPRMRFGKNMLFCPNLNVLATFSWNCCSIPMLRSRAWNLAGGWPWLKGCALYHLAENPPNLANTCFWEGNLSL